MVIQTYRKENKKDAKMITGDIQAIQTTLENLWDLTKQSTITRIFEVHQSELKISRTVLCERLGLDEQMYQPSTRENRPEHLNDEIDYRKQVTDNPKLQEILKTAAFTGHFQSILNVAQGMEASSSLGASQLGNTVMP